MDTPTVASRHRRPMDEMISARARLAPLCEKGHSITLIPILITLNAKHGACRSRWRCAIRPAGRPLRRHGGSSRRTDSLHRFGVANRIREFQAKESLFSIELPRRLARRLDSRTTTQDPHTHTGTLTLSKTKKKSSMRLPALGEHQIVIARRHSWDKERARARVRSGQSVVIIIIESLFFCF